MSIVWGSNSHTFGAPIGVITSALMQAADDGGLPINAAAVTGFAGPLSGVVSASVVGGQVQVTVDATVLSAGTYWFDLHASTDGGATWFNGGGQVMVYAADVETITIGSGVTHTLSADLPSAGKTTLIVNFADLTSILDGSASHYRIVTNAAVGGVFLNGPGTCYRLGDSTNRGIEVDGLADGRLHLDGITFDTCGAIRYTHGLYKEGTCQFINNTILPSSAVVIDGTSDASRYAVGVFGEGNRQHPCLFDGNRIGKSFFSWSIHYGDATNNIMRGDRCGFVLGGNLNPGSIRNNYIETLFESTWSQVANSEWGTGTIPADFGDNIFRRGEWQLRAVGGFPIRDNVFADQQSHLFLDVAGHATLDTVIERNIFLPTKVTYSDSPSDYLINSVGWIMVRGDHVQINHNTFAGEGLGRSPQPPIVIAEGMLLDSLADNLMVGLTITRGSGLTGDALVVPLDSSGIHQNMSGSPLRAGSTPNRMTVADYNGLFDNASGDGDTFETYGVGTVSGSPGAHDITADPEFLIGSYTFPSDSDIWDRVPGATVPEMLDAIRAAFTLGATSPMRGTASDSTHIGGVQLTPATAATLDGALVGAAAAVCALTTAITAAATIAGVALVAGALTTAIAMGAGASGTATATAALTTAIPIAASVTGTATTTGLLSTAVALGTMSATGTATTGAALTTAIQFAGGVVGTGVVTGTLSEAAGPSTLTGAATVTATATCLLSAAETLTGTATARATVTCGLYTATVESSNVDQAVVDLLRADATLSGLMPDGVFFDEAPEGATRVVIVSLVSHDDVAVFGGRGYADAIYAVKAVALSTSGGNVRAAAARIDALLEDQPLVIAGFDWMTTYRVARLRATEVDELDASMRWQHRGGHYRVMVAPT